MILPYPISTNLYWRTFRGRVVVSAAARAYKADVELIARRDGMSLFDCEVFVEYMLHPKLTKEGNASKTRIDLDNAMKVVSDALNGIAYTDDKLVVEIHARIGYPVAGGGVTVKVRPAALFLENLYP